MRPRHRDADALAARVAQRDRAAVVGQRGAQHAREHRLVARGHEDDVGQAAQVGDVEGAVVRRAVVAHEAGAVHGEDDVELLQADVVDDLVVGALQEGRVDGAHRLGALERQPGGEEHGLLLGDAHVEVVGGLGLLQDAQPGAGVHRRRDPDDARVAPDLSHHGLAEDLRVLRRRRARRGLGRHRGAGDDRARLGGVPAPPCPRGRPPRPGRSPCPSRWRCGRRRAGRRPAPGAGRAAGRARRGRR